MLSGVSQNNTPTIFQIYSTTNTSTKSQDSLPYIIREWMSAFTSLEIKAFLNFILLLTKHFFIKNNWPYYPCKTSLEKTYPQ